MCIGAQAAGGGPLFIALLVHCVSLLLTLTLTLYHRNSKLTHRLQDALGGSSRLLVVACISTAASHILGECRTLLDPKEVMCVCLCL